MDPAPSGGDGRRRGKKNRGKKGRNRRGAKGRGNRGNQRQNKKQGFVPPEYGRDDTSILGGRQPRSSDGPQYEEGKAPDAFQLFCAYHMGITLDDGYQEPRFEAVARRFGLKPDEFREELKKHNLDDQSMQKSSFDLKGARMDMRLAPVGISRTESARELFEEFQECLEG
jgi:hypothetical protein